MTPYCVQYWGPTPEGPHVFREDDFSDLASAIASAQEAEDFDGLVVVIERVGVYSYTEEGVTNWDFKDIIEHLRID